MKFKPLLKYGLATILGLGLFEMAYYLAANYVLREGLLFRLINTRPEQLRLHYDKATTVIPGLVHIEGFLIEGHDGHTTWHVELKKAKVVVSLSSLLFRKFKAYRVDAEGGLFRLRLGVPKLPPKPKKPGDENKPKKKKFEIDIRNISIASFNDLAIHNYAYQGEAHIGGSFYLRPGEELRIPEALVEFKGGKVSLAERNVSTSLTGSIRAHIESWFPKEEKSAVIIDRLSADVQLQGELQDADFLNYYVKAIPWLNISGFNGKFSTDARIINGTFLAPSSAELTATEMGAAMGRYRAKGSGTLDWKLADGDDKMRMNLHLRHYRGYDRDEKTPIIEGDSLNLVVDSYNLALRKIFSDISAVTAHIDLQPARITDLRFMNNFVPVGNGLEILSGTAAITAKLNASTRGPAEAGFLQLQTQGAQARFKESKMSGDFNLKIPIQDTEAGTKKFKVSGTEFTMSQVKVHGAQRKNILPPKPWGGKVGLSEAWVEPQSSVIFKGKAELAFDNARPILAVLRQQSRFVGVIQDAAKMNNLRGESAFRLGPNIVELNDLKLNSSDVQLLGRMRLTKDEEIISAFLKYRIVEVALHLSGKKSETKLIKARKWFEALPPLPPVQETAR